MNQHRTVARWCAGLLMAGAFAAGSVLPAQAASASTAVVGVSVHVHAHGPTHTVSPLFDTGWN